MFYLFIIRGILYFYKREYKYIYLNVGVSIKWKVVVLFYILKIRLILLYYSCRYSKCGNESVEWIIVIINSSLCWKIKLYVEYIML